MIVSHVCWDVVVQEFYSDRMQRRLVGVIAFLCVVPIQFYKNVLYVGFLIVWNEAIFENDLVYQKINATIFFRHFSVVHVHFVKKLVFSNVEVCFTLNHCWSFIFSWHSFSYAIKCHPRRTCTSAGSISSTLLIHFSLWLIFKLISIWISVQK